MEIRGIAEILVFLCIKVILIILTIIGIALFIIEARRHTKLKAGERDNLTAVTFILIATSQIAFITCIIYYNLVHLAVDFHNAGYYEAFSLSIIEFNLIDNIIRAILKILIALNCQNIAFLTNIHRWELILLVNGTISHGLTISKSN